MILSERDVVASNSVNDRDHGAVVVVTAAFGTTCFLVFFLARLAIRWPLRSLSGIDDLVLLVATCIATAQVGTIVGAVQAGFGKTIVASTQIPEAKKLLYASDLLYIAAKFLSRLVVGLMFIRLSTSASQTRVSRTILGAGIAFGVTAIVMFAVQPNSYGTKNVIDPESIFARWIAIEVMGMLLDISCMIFPIYLVHNLQMRRRRKLQVITGFALRFPLLILSILRLLSLSTTLWSNEFMFSYATTEIYTQAIISYGLASATLPCLRIFLGSFTTGILGGDLTMMASSHMSTDRSATKSSPREGRNRTGAIRSTNKSFTHELRNLGRGINQTNASRGSQHKDDAASDSSQRAIVVQRTLDGQYDADHPTGDRRTP